VERSEINTKIEQILTKDSNIQQLIRAFVCPAVPISIQKLVIISLF